MQFRFFPSLFQRPNKIRFDAQEDNETIELFLRQHPIVNVGWVTLSLIILLLPPFLLQLDIISGFNYANRIPVNLLLGGLVIYYLLLLAYAFEEFLSWYFNVYIVTNQHLIDVNFYSILAKEVIEISLDDIEVISQNVAGVFSSLFHYGDVHIETAAENVALKFEKVPRPDFVADRIQDLQRNRKLFFEGDKP
jgi:uncharacterized membrane protein YdbT with pleckstrin-like domain